MAGSTGPLRVELMAVDYEVTLRLDDREVARTTPQEYRPDVSKLLADYAAQRQQPLPTVEIAAANQTSALL